MIFPKYLDRPQDTFLAGEQLGLKICDKLKSGQLTLPCLLTLKGDLGAGKTTFCQGLGKALGVLDQNEIISPTFTLANEYPGPRPIFHLDLYRLDNEDQFYEAGLDEYLRRPALTVVEWPEKMPSDIWPDKRLDLSINFKDQGRIIEIINPENDLTKTLFQK